MGIAIEPGRNFMSGVAGTPSWESPRPVLTTVPLSTSTRRSTPLASSFCMTPCVIEMICFDTSALLVHVPPMSIWFDEHFELVAAPAVAGSTAATTQTITAATNPHHHRSDNLLLLILLPLPLSPILVSLNGCF